MHVLIRDFLLGVQRDLETQNSLPVLPNVDAFIITSAERRELTECTSDEQVFVGEDRLGVYIAEPLLDRVSRQQGNLNDYCTAIEGISHFLYLMHHDRQVKLLELELQAEVDKFIHVANKLPVDQTDLLDALFERYSLHTHLNEEERDRYIAATRHAARFCHRLSKVADKKQAVRDFYRLPLEEKLRQSR